MAEDGTVDWKHPVAIEYWKELRATIHAEDQIIQQYEGALFSFASALATVAVTLLGLHVTGVTSAKVILLVAFATAVAGAAITFVVSQRVLLFEKLIETAVGKATAAEKSMPEIPGGHDLTAALNRITSSRPTLNSVGAYAWIIVGFFVVLAVASLVLYF